MKNISGHCDSVIKSRQKEIDNIIQNNKSRINIIINYH